MRLAYTIAIGVGAWYLANAAIESDANLGDSKVATGTYIAIGIGVAAALIARKVIK